MPRKADPPDHVPANLDARTKGGTAFTSFVVELFRLNGIMIAVGDDITNDLGMTSARWQVLGAVGNEPKTVAAAARVMGLTRQNVQRIADWLVEAGLARYVDNPAHLRAKLVALTAKGVTMRQRIGRRQAKWANGVAGHFSLAELELTIDVLRRMQRRVR